jgi:hypothetical protein
MPQDVACRVAQLLQEFQPLEIGGPSLSTAEMEISIISYHMRSIYQKLHVHSKSEAVAKALRDRLIQ